MARTLSDRDHLTKSRLALLALLPMFLLLTGCATATESVVSTAQPAPLACPSSLTDVHSGSRLGRPAPNAPDSALFCKYAGLNEKIKYGTLIRFTVVQNPSALAALLNQSKPVPVGAVYPCPSDSGSRDALVFVKAKETTTVIIQTSGCPFVSSTNASGRWFLSKAAASELQKLDPALAG
ncbi:MAG TPA: hypothetical protein VMV52_00105 [Candidatus Nanopelagicaceae bacterium]|nr:hypothetical protein [Candidatus Nanopelagicaceae bacterium]